MSGQRGTQGGPWFVTDYDGEPLPGSWPTFELARDEGLCGRYLLSGFAVECRTDPSTPTPTDQTKERDQ